MIEFDAVLGDARQLSPQDRMRLIDALWESVPEDADCPFHQEWAAEFERRLAALREGRTDPIPWDLIRQEALGRIGHGNIP